MPSLTTETGEVFANPGGSFTLEQHAHPVRVRQGAGWAQVDTRLRRQVDGSVGPAATTARVTFSGGGDQPLARLHRDGHELRLGWPARLPEPALDGDTATYPEVLPGVDLRVQATVDGFAQVLVVRSAEAASNPALHRLRLNTTGSTGLTVVSEPNGGLKAVTATGRVVFRAPTPLMWDSSGAEAASGSVRGPGTGSRQAAMAVEARPGELAVLPDRRMLTDPKTRYPLFIDPTWGGTRQAHAMVSKYYSTYNGSGDVKVGYYNDPNASPTSDTYRSFFRMDTSQVRGKQILSATFRIRETHSWSCSPRAVELWATSSISASMAWHAQPTWAYRMDTRSVAHGYSSSCGPADVEFNTLQQVKDAAAGGWTSVTMGLRASDETDKYGWKKFNNNPVLSITYNTAPNVPTNSTTYPDQPCLTGESRPVVGPPGTVRMLATVADPDGGNVRARFEWYDIGGARLGETLTAAKSSGLQHEAVVPSTDIGTGRTLSWRVRAEDGTAVSAWSASCEVTVDPQAPTNGPTVSSTTYPAIGVNGGIGQPGSFTFGPNGVTDVASYEYELDGAAGGTGTVAAGGDLTATVSLTPPDSEALLHTLLVRSLDVANSPGPWTTYSFQVGGRSAPAGHWTFDEASGTTAADSSGDNRTATLGAGAGWTGGRVGGALTTDGATGHASASSVAQTSSSFTVSAWVRLDTAGQDRTAVSQDGSKHSAFFLGYDSSDQKWSFKAPVLDSLSNFMVIRAASDAPAPLGAWTHLAGVFDASTREIRLYVDGALAGTAARGSYTWPAVGSLQIGRGKKYGSAVNYWSGAIDDVRVWNRVVYPSTIGGTASEIRNLSNQPPRAEGAWALDEAAGTSTADTSGNGRTATLHGGASWGEGYTSGALELDGTTGHAATAGQVLRTDSSFTVSAWVRLDRTAGVGYPSAVSQVGTRTAAFSLGYSEPDARWVATMATTDADTATSVRALASPDQFPVTAGEWTHLTLVYDDAVDRMHLYVNGIWAAGDTIDARWTTGGPLTIGRAMGNGNPTDFWPGAVDEVRVWTGALTDAQVNALPLEIYP
ncbi:LamG-like jellyroll fold domain-containing protein [Micromonospora sp. NPDC002717]|uniref:LamG-like jellyroll fold domain-containing protein n=1 Tax=Micromonospora sp. NPDC002717 TaxID=3154424 RepID=UPI00332ABB52